jgi:hypothetical protein
VATNRNSKNIRTYSKQNTYETNIKTNNVSVRYFEYSKLSTRSIIIIIITTTTTTTTTIIIIIIIIIITYFEVVSGKYSPSRNRRSFWKQHTP